MEPFPGANSPLFKPKETGQSTHGQGGPVAAAERSSDDLQFLISAIGFGIDMAHKLNPGEDRQRIIPANAFGWRRINLPSVIVTPKPTREPPIVDQRVERGQEFDLDRGRHRAIKKW